MLRSMTGFATARGGGEGFSWTWELRSVNGKGLDMRLRVPDWIEGLEAGLRARLAGAMARGNVNLTLKVARDQGAGALAVNPARLEDALSALEVVEARAAERGVALAPATAADLLALRGIFDTPSDDTGTEALTPVLVADMEPVLAAFLKMREAEGQALARVLTAQLDAIERLTEAAAEAAEARLPETRRAFALALARVTETVQADEARVAQEMAMMAVKQDVTEEIDRLRAHVAAARELLAAGSPVGRKLDFLMQEFNREANTLCSKAQNAALTALGLELKTVIDQMREQVQNVE
ncbi:YicC/YloC family endoribonuclease [Roseovarius amoyensis]|uniref:YicC/YloC family endoribonuclease n=1 Tax=Roseovarius amoyensis TaxID=2211448 RepID=UPI000DBE357A|nr:YicC/YloC family endoribonuclease [Roseovarius amoyensis]